MTASMFLESCVTCPLHFGGSNDEYGQLRRQSVPASDLGITTDHLGFPDRPILVAEKAHLSAKHIEQHADKKTGPISGARFNIWCRLQDLNPPPDDYKALEIS
ncbi:hypothetical protein [Pandoraea fibrosis]|uniref:hypothetical protein n=1 Tax=Pandoraea fibrosis TaxID=1891094 RepID=UPI0012415ABB|nr:hypothetical protein [Pandoraea fibrosis]